MVSLSNMTIGMFSILIIWWAQVFLVQYEVNRSAKKTRRSKTKLKEEYPYFSFPLWKRIFCVGLSKAMPKYFVVLSFIVNFIVVLNTILCIVYLFIPSMEYSNFLKLFLMIAMSFIAFEFLIFVAFIKERIEL